MSALDTLRGVDKLLELTPYFRCPSCGRRDEEGDGNHTFFSLKLEATMPLQVDDVTHRLTGDLADVELMSHFLPVQQILVCAHCQTEFKVPPDWTVHF